MTSLDAELLVQHLEDLHCGGVVNEAVLHGALGARGASWDGGVLLTIPEIDDTVPLADDIGILDVKQLLRAVRDLTPSQGTGKIRLEVEDRALILYAPGLGESRIPVDDPRDVEPYSELTLPDILTREPVASVYFSSDMIDKLLGDVKRIGTEEIVLRWGPRGVVAVVADSSGAQAAQTMLDEAGVDEDGELVLPPEFFPLLKRAEKMDRLDILGPRGPVILRRRNRFDAIIYPI